MGDREPRPPSFRRPVALGRRAVRHAMAADVPFMAGAIAYQSFVSLLPLLFLLVVVVATVDGTDATRHLLAITVGQLPSDSRDIIRGAVREAVDRTGNSVVGVAVLGFGAFAVFNGFDKAFTELYGTEKGRTLPDQVRDAAVVLVALAAALVVIATAWHTVVLPERVPLYRFFRPIVLAVGLAATFYPMFYVFPEVDLGWREVLPGVVVAAVGWTALQSLFGLYVEHVLRTGALGVVSGVLLLAIWLYFSGFVLLLGGALNAVLHGYGAGAEGGEASVEAASDGG